MARTGHHALSICTSAQVRMSSDERIDWTREGRRHSRRRHGRRSGVISGPARIVSLHLNRGRRCSHSCAGRQSGFDKVSASRYIGTCRIRARSCCYLRGREWSRPRRIDERVRCWSHRRKEAGCVRRGRWDRSVGTMSICVKLRRCDRGGATEI